LEAVPEISPSPPQEQQKTSSRWQPRLKVAESKKAVETKFMKRGFAKVVDKVKSALGSSKKDSPKEDGVDSTLQCK
jgi:hypothetical protein